MSKKKHSRLSSKDLESLKVFIDWLVKESLIPEIQREIQSMAWRLTQLGMRAYKYHQKNGTLDKFLSVGFNDGDKE